MAVELRTASPLLRPGLLRGRPVLTANLFCLLLGSGQFAAFYFVSLCLQQVFGYGPTAAGAAFLPFCVGVVAGSVIATRTVARLGTRRLLATGGALAALGIAGFAATARADGTFLTSILGRPWSPPSASACASYRSAPRPPPMSCPGRPAWPRVC